MTFVNSFLSVMWVVVVLAVILAHVVSLIFCIGKMVIESEKRKDSREMVFLSYLAGVIFTLIMAATLITYCCYQPFSVWSFSDVKAAYVHAHPPRVTIRVTQPENP